eukprot:1062350-Pelagomonas_calceolata.AAC.1
MLGAHKGTCAPDQPMLLVLNIIMSINTSHSGGMNHYTKQLAKKACMCGMWRYSHLLQHEENTRYGRMEVHVLWHPVSQEPTCPRHLAQGQHTQIIGRTCSVALPGIRSRELLPKD